MVTRTHYVFRYIENESFVDIIVNKKSSLSITGLRCRRLACISGPFFTLQLHFFLWCLPFTCTPHVSFKQQPENRQINTLSPPLHPLPPYISTLFSVQPKVRIPPCLSKNDTVFFFLLLVRCLSYSWSLSLCAQQRGDDRKRHKSSEGDMGVSKRSSALVFLKGFVLLFPCSCTGRLNAKKAVITLPIISPASFLRVNKFCYCECT